MEELVDLIIEKMKGYGTDDQPITMGILRAILQDVKKDIAFAKVISDQEN